MYILWVLSVASQTPLTSAPQNWPPKLIASSTPKPIPNIGYTITLSIDRWRETACDDDGGKSEKSAYSGLHVANGIRLTNDGEKKDWARRRRRSPNISKQKLNYVFTYPFIFVTRILENFPPPDWDPTSREAASQVVKANSIGAYIYTCKVLYGKDLCIDTPIQYRSI